MKLPINYDKSHWTTRREARLQYISDQNNICIHCGSSLDRDPSEEVNKMKINKNLFPKGMFDYPIHLHHDRTTGMSIGAVHAKCNAVLWQYHGE
ncbi:MAG: hypothetical protein L3I99_01825 [Sulfurimonas sp.]|nr:hypothetical protein [Sulfurimonas sp.]